MITGLHGEADGLRVTMTFTVQGSPGRGPFSCELRWPHGVEEFPCNPGPVSRTHDFVLTGHLDLYAFVTDASGLRSDKAYGGVVVAPIPRPTYANLHGWAGDGVVNVAFRVTPAPGDHPSCVVRVEAFPSGGAQNVTAANCEGDVVIQANGGPGTYWIDIAFTSSAPTGPPAPPSPHETLQIT